MQDFKVMLRVASGGPENLETGEQWCPGCNRIYNPTYPDLDSCPPEDKVSREQHISGVCSQQCWDEVTREDPEED